MPKRLTFDTMVLLSINDMSFLMHRLPMAMAAKSVCRDVYVICKNTGKCEQIRDLGFIVIELPLTKANSKIVENFQILRKLVESYRSIKPDLLLHSSVEMSFIGSLAKLFIGNTPSINSITGIGYLFSSDRLMSRFLRFLLWPLMLILWRRSDTLMLFQNPDDRQVFASWGLSQEDAPLIPGSGVNIRDFRPVVKKNLSFKKSRPFVIGCATRLLRDKGIPELMDAVKIIAKNYDIELRIAGEIYPRNPSSCTTEDVDRWSKIPSVKFLGNLSDMVVFWQGCDVAILPSHREGFPKALLEAASCGLPLLGANVPGVREIVVNKLNGLLFLQGDCRDIADKIEDMICDHKFRQSAGKASREIVSIRGLSNKAVEASFVGLFNSMKTRVVSANNR